MIANLKSWTKSALPGRVQVPLKYWFSVVKRETEIELRHLSELVLPGDRVIDIGGNRGLYAYCLWRLGAQVEIFEPNPDCAELLRRWSAGKAGIVVHQTALSDHESVAELRIPIDEHGVEHDSSASLEPRSEGRYRTESVRLKTLDSYRFVEPKLVKIDTEGHETAVVTGAIQTLIAAHPILIVEIEQRHLSTPIAQSFVQITEIGYDGFFFYRGLLRPLEEFRLDVHQRISGFESGQDYCNNFIFIGKDRPSQERAARFLSKVR